MLILMMDALVIIDFQNYLRRYDPRHQDYMDDVDKAIAKTEELIETARDTGQEVIIVANVSTDEDIHLDHKKQMIQNNIKAGIVPEIQKRITAETPVFIKMESTAINGIHIRTEQSFREYLRERKFDNIYLAGTTILDCVKASGEDVTNDPSLPKPTYIRDCCDDFNPPQTEKFLSDKKTCVAEELKKKWDESKPETHIKFVRGSNEMPDTPQAPQTTRPVRTPLA